MDETLRNAIISGLYSSQCALEAAWKQVAKARMDLIEALDLMLSHLPDLPQGLGLYQAGEIVHVGMTDGTGPTEAPVISVQVEYVDEDTGGYVVYKTITLDEKGQQRAEEWRALTPLVCALARPFQATYAWLSQGQGQEQTETVAPTYDVPPDGVSAPPDGVSAPPDNAAQRDYIATTLKNGESREVEIRALNAQSARDVLREQGYEVLTVIEKNPSPNPNTDT